MKAHRIALPILAAVTLLSTGVGVAYADEPADCGAAITAMNNADTAHRDAVAADDKADKARDADRDLTQAEKKLTEAQEKETAAEKAAEANGEGSRDDADPKLITAPEQKVIDEAKALVVTRTSEVAAARTKADRTDADKLRNQARKTDAPELKTAFDEAKADFDRLCINTDDADPAVEDPAPADPAPVEESPVVEDDFSQVGTAPVGGVQTGGWSL